MNNCPVLMRRARYLWGTVARVSGLVGSPARMKDTIRIRSGWICSIVTGVRRCLVSLINLHEWTCSHSLLISPPTRPRYVVNVQLTTCSWVRVSQLRTMVACCNHVITMCFYDYYTPTISHHEHLTRNPYFKDVKQPLSI